MLLATYAHHASEFVALAGSMPANGAVSTSGASTWIRDNVVQVVILVVAVVALLAAGRGDNSKIIRIIGGIAMALAILAMSTGTNAENVGSWLLGLVVTG